MNSSIYLRTFTSFKNGTYVDGVNISSVTCRFRVYNDIMSSQLDLGVRTLSIVLPYIKTLIKLIKQYMNNKKIKIHKNKIHL